MTCDGGAVIRPKSVSAFDGLQYYNSVRDLIGRCCGGYVSRDQTRRGFSNLVSQCGVFRRRGRHHDGFRIPPTADGRDCENGASGRLWRDTSRFTYRNIVVQPRKIKFVLSYLDSGIPIISAVQIGINAFGPRPLSMPREQDQWKALLSACRSICHRLPALLLLLNATPDGQLMEAAPLVFSPIDNRFRSTPRVWHRPPVHNSLISRRLVNCHLDGAHRDEVMYPTFSEDLIDAMRTETDRTH